MQRGSFLKKNITLILIFLFIFSCSAASRLPEVKIEMNNKIYKFEVAATNEARSKGLMFRKKLGKNEGMLFVYKQKSILYFYMKNTLIPLDIAFIDDNHKIIDIQSMEPLDETTITSNGKAMFALEVNRGFFERIGVKQGDEIKFMTPVPYID